MIFTFTFDPSQETCAEDVHHNLIPYRFIAHLRNGKVSFFFGSLLAQYFRPYTIMYDLWILNVRGNKTRKKLSSAHTYKNGEDPCWGYVDYWNLDELHLQSDGKLKCHVQLHYIRFESTPTTHVGLMNAMLTSTHRRLLEANRTLEREKEVLLGELETASKRVKLNESCDKFEEYIETIVDDGTIEEVNQWMDVLKETMVTLGERKPNLKDVCCAK